MELWSGLSSEQNAFVAYLYENYQDNVFRYMLRRATGKLPDSRYEEARDLYCETFMEVCKTLARQKGLPDFHEGELPWLMGVARNRLRKHYRDVKRLTCFKITEESMEGLKSAEVPKGVLLKLYDIRNEEFTGKDKFLSKLEATLGKELVVQYKAAILKHAKRFYAREKDTSFFENLSDESDEPLKTQEEAKERLEFVWHALNDRHKVAFFLAEPDEVQDSFPLEVEKLKQLAKKYNWNDNARYKALYDARQKANKVDATYQSYQLAGV